MRILTFLIILLFSSVAMAGHPYTTHHTANITNKINDKDSALINKVIVQSKIQVFDTQLLTPHNQYFKYVPDDPYTETIIIERVIAPKEYIIQEQVIPLQDYSLHNVAPSRQTVIVEQNIENKYYQQAVQCISRYRNHCGY